MTLENLMDELANLASTGEQANMSQIISSANRAMRDIFSRRAIYKTVRLYTKGLKPSYYRREINCKGGTEVTLPLQGAAFSMRLCGAGTYSIFDGDILNAYPFKAPLEGKVVKGFIKTGGKIKFLGQTSYTVYDYSVYSDVYTEQVSEIPDGGNRVTIDIRTRLGDFMSFAHSPCDPDGKEIPGCVLYDGKIELDSDYRGEIILTYRRLPGKIEGYYEDEIDIPAEYSHLLPLLTAYYVFLETDSSLAKEFKDRYEEMLSHMEQNGYQGINTRYIDVNGWA